MNRQVILILVAILVLAAVIVGWNWYSHEARRQERIEDASRAIEVGNSASEQTSARRRLEAEINTQQGKIELIRSEISSRHETIVFMQGQATEWEGLIARAETLARQAAEQGRSEDEVEQREQVARRTTQKHAAAEAIAEARNDIEKLEAELDLESKALDSMRARLVAMPY